MAQVSILEPYPFFFFNYPFSPPFELPLSLLPLPLPVFISAPPDHLPARIPSDTQTTEMSTKSETTIASSPAPPASLSVVKELIAGTVGGTAQILVGHPFDTVKVKLQSMKPTPGKPPLYTGAIDVVRKVAAKEGIMGLFAGIQAPLPFVAVFNAALFAANGTMRQLIGQGRPGDQLTLPEVGLSGVGAGIAVSFVACPTELVKCRLQAQPGVFAGAIDCTRQVVASRGMGGLFTGMSATISREIPGNALYFMGYAATKRAMVPEGGSDKDLSAAQLMFAGGMAGLGTLRDLFLSTKARNR